LSPPFRGLKGLNSAFLPGTAAGKGGAAPICLKLCRC